MHPHIPTHLNKKDKKPHHRLQSCVLTDTRWRASNIHQLATELRDPSSILLNKGFDERRGSVLIWIRNLCLCAPFLSRLPSTTPLWFKAVFGFSSASQVITFQHVAPFRGGINYCCYFFIPHTPGPRGTKKRKKGVDILTLSLSAHLHACLCCVNVLYALCLSSLQNSFLIANFR